MAVKTYDPKQVIVIAGGFQLSGFSDGSVVTVTYNEDAWAHVVGTDGEGTRSKSNNFSAEVTATLMQSSDSNAFLSAFAEADRVSNSGSFPLLIKDASGDSLYVAESAWVKKIPDSEFAREAGTREWVLSVDNLVAFVGGN